MRYLILSDIHLSKGTEQDGFANLQNTAIREQHLLNFISQYDPQKIILNGDTYETWITSKRKIQQAHPQLVEFFDNDDRIMYIYGNHDFKLRGKQTVLLHTAAGKKILITHGHQADPWMQAKMSRFFTWCIALLQSLLGFDQRHHIFTKYRFKTTKTTKRVRNYARELLKQDYDVAVLGHCHAPSIETFPNGKIYANSGTCIEGRLEGVLIDTDHDEIQLLKE